MATFCPYCIEEINDAIYRFWVGCEWKNADDFKCPYCQKKMRVKVELVLDFIVGKK